MCASFGILLALLTIHFYYRYICVACPKKLLRFSLRNCFLWILLVLSNFSIWFYCCYIWNGSNDIKNEIVIPEFREVYCLEPNDYAYTGAQYFYGDLSTGTLHMYTPSFAAEGTTGSIIVLCLILLTYFGYQTYNHLYKLVQLTSHTTMEHQNQLFQTLVLQTIIPAIFMYFPASCMVLFPLFQLKIGAIANLVMTSVSIYPCFEPLVAMYCIKRFRKRIIGEICLNMAFEFEHNSGAVCCGNPVKKQVRVQPMTCL